MDERVIQFLSYLYNFTFLPIYYYQEETLVFSIPPESIDYQPPAIYRDAFLSAPYNVAYLLTEFGGLYGYVKDIPRGGYYILGPCTSVNYDDHTLFSMRREFCVNEADSRSFVRFLKGIPCKNNAEFLSQLSFLNCCANASQDIPRDLTAEYSCSVPSSLVPSLENYSEEENIRENNSLDIEKQMLGFVESGDSEGLEIFLSCNLSLNAGQVGNTLIRNTKNYSIIAVTLTCRAAIRGGLPSDIAFRLSDSYIQQIEAAGSASTLDALCTRLLRDYTERVSKFGVFGHLDPLIQRSIRFIQRNISRKITVVDVASYVGLSRGYFSSYFKNTVGCEVSVFIRRCRLEEAKSLLKNPELSIAEISEYLCFSSQSHFQNSFKNEYGITPRQYRRGAFSDKG